MNEGSKLDSQKSMGSLPKIARAAGAASLIGLSAVLTATAASCGDVDVIYRPNTGATTGSGGFGGNTSVDSSSGQGGEIGAGGEAGTGGQGGMGGGQAGGPSAFTRGDFAVALAHDVMGHTDDGDCVPTFSDTPADSALCDAVDALQMRGAMSGFEDGLFHPELEMVRGQVWSELTKALGFAKYNAPCVDAISDLDPSEWVNTVAGAMCEKGFTITKQDGTAEPYVNMTADEWATLQTELTSYFSADLTRGGIAERMEVILRKIAVPADIQCQSQFSDIPDDTLTCFFVEDLVANGLINGYVDANGNPTGIFDPDGNINNAGLAKIYVTTKQLPLDACNGCSGSPNGAWYCSYADTLCNAGYIGNSFDPSKIVINKDASQLAWNLDIGTKLF